MFCLEAFGVSKGRPAVEQQWLTCCLEHVLKNTLTAAAPEDVNRCIENAQERVQHETADIYNAVDVRAWPNILELFQLEHTRT